MITPYLSWSLPDVLSTPGSQYASMYNNIMLSLDALLGTQFTPSQINVNSDLDFQGNDAINVRSVRLANAGAVTSPGDINCVYDFSGNLWFNDSVGNQIQVTNNGSVNAGNGNISGIAGTSASVTFNSVTNAYTFNATPTRLASLNALTGVFGAIVVSGTLTAAVASITSASYGNIQTLTGSLVQATVVSGGTGNFGVGNIPTLNNTTLNGNVGTFTQLTSSGGKITTLTATTATVGGAVSAGSVTVNGGSITAPTGNITSLTSSGASLGAANATSLITNALTVTGTPTFGALNITGQGYVGGALAVTGNLNPLGNINLATTASLVIPSGQQSITFYVAPVLYPGSGTPSAQAINGCPVVPTSNPYYFPLRLPRAGTITQLQCNIYNNASQPSPTSFQFRRMAQNVDPGSVSATTIALIQSGSAGLCNFLMTGLNETFKDTDPYWYYVGITAGSGGSIAVNALAVTVTVPCVEAGIRG